MIAPKSNTVLKFMQDLTTSHLDAVCKMWFRDNNILVPKYPWNRLDQIYI